MSPILPALIRSPPTSPGPSSSHSVHLEDVGIACQPSSHVHRHDDRAPVVDSRIHHAQDSRPVTRINLVEAKSTQTHQLVSQEPVHHSGPSNCTDSAQLLVPPHSATLPSTPLQQSLNSQPPDYSCQYFPQSQHHNLGMFNNSCHFSATGNFIEGPVGTVSYNNINSNNFMKELLKETIPASFDSLARDPPPRCHPGTRMTVLEQCLAFIGNCEGEKKMRWVFGAAGVGKSAIMQSIAESPDLQVACHASVFFSVNGRADGTKAIKTISYQLAAKCKPYRQLIEQEINSDPSLLQASMAVQFKKLIVEPFIHNSQLNSAGRVLVIIDGLDECNNRHIQQELLRLISDFCMNYPSSPLVWLIASRPEPHIISFFSKTKVMPAYEKEEILVDSDEACQDVERFLRHELTEIKEASDSLSRRLQWPEERDLWKIANAAGGLFAYADTAVKYIGDSTMGGPASQLSHVLHVIDNHPMADIPREEHPMALLDALYARILSNVPSQTIKATRKFLLALATGWAFSLYPDQVPFIVSCNWLAMTPDEAYAAIDHLRSVLFIPRYDRAHEEALVPFHKSFFDYISDFNRSGFFDNIKHQAQQLKTKCAFRVLKEAPDGIDFSKTGYYFAYGSFKCCPGTGGTISLTWSVDEGSGWSDDETRQDMYTLAIGEVVAGMERGEKIFQDEACIRLLTTQFNYYGLLFPHSMLCDLVFDKPRRHDFLTHGILKQIPLGAVDILERDLYTTIDLQFCCPASPLRNFLSPWNSLCNHERRGKWEEEKDQDWMTTFDKYSCLYCLRRFKHQLNNWKTRHPDHTIPILPTSTGECFAEIKFVYLKSGIPCEWTYRFSLLLRQAVCEEYGCTV